MYQPPHPYPPQPYQQPPRPGFGRLMLDMSFNPLNWFLFFKKPTVTINGQAQQVEWGQLPVDLSAGQHHVEIGFWYTGKLRGVARATIPVQPGQVQPVFYRAPAHVMTGGAIGPVRQSTPGIWVVWLMVGIALLMMLLSFL